MLNKPLRRYLTVGVVVAATGIAGLVALPAFATAESVGRVRFTPGTAQVPGIIEFTAGVGLVNRMDVGGTLDPILGAKDLNPNPIELDPSARGICRLTSRFSFRCQDTKPFTAILNLGDRDDTYENTNGYVATTVRGGSGNDILDASFSNDPVKLYGEDGNDQLTGGDGRDILDAGPATAPQLTDGGGGRDRCSGQQIRRLRCERPVLNPVHPAPIDR
jgi:hypothetical protein